MTNQTDMFNWVAWPTGGEGVKPNIGEGVRAWVMGAMLYGTIEGFAGSGVIIRVTGHEGGMYDKGDREIVTSRRVQVWR